MTITREIYWNKLAQIKELKEFFEEDFEGFKKLIQDNIQEIEKFSPQALDNFAKLRVLEVTNGCTQWAFRRGDKECLSVEQTRECMKVVMGFMKRSELYFPSEGQIEFDEAQKKFMKDIRNLFIKAFKKNVPGLQSQFHGTSTAQFIVYGHERLYKAMALVKQDYEYLFSPYYIERGQKYIGAYLEGYSS